MHLGVFDAAANFRQTKPEKNGDLRGRERRDRRPATLAVRRRRFAFGANNRDAVRFDVNLGAPFFLFHMQVKFSILFGKMFFIVRFRLIC